MSPTRLGERIVAPSGTPLGAVDDVILDLETGEVTHLIITLDHVFGLQERRFAVRPQAFEEHSSSLVLDAEPEALVSPDTATLLLV